MKKDECFYAEYPWWAGREDFFGIDVPRFYSDFGLIAPEMGISVFKDAANWYAAREQLWAIENGFVDLTD